MKKVSVKELREMYPDGCEVSCALDRSTNSSTKAIVKHDKINRLPNGSYYIVNDEFLNVYLWSIGTGCIAEIIKK
tara:strand:- start:9086 stop:9310 length:225 start_codon:yes stop_codon:yes gene_type:complete